MGFVSKSDGVDDFSKGVISIFFSVPAESITAAQSQYDGLDFDNFPDFLWDPNLAGIIPLFTFGANPAISTMPYNISPSFIGINCGASFHGDARGEGDVPSLCARIQYDTGTAEFTNLGATIANDSFQVGYVGRYGPGVPADQDSRIAVSADTIHHVLVSFDVSSGCSGSVSGSPPLGIDLTGPSQFMWAFDDVNYAGAYLFPTNPACFGGSGGSNDIYSAGCINCPGDVASTYSFSAGDIPVDGFAMGVPSSSGNSDFVYQIRVARLQVFRGVTVDTSVELNRRAFIKSNGQPASLSAARALLGAIPVIEFNRAEDWIAGRNSGSGGNFTKTGTVSVYTVP